MIDKGIANGKYIETNNTDMWRKKGKILKKNFLKKEQYLGWDFHTHLKTRNLASYLSIK